MEKQIKSRFSTIHIFFKNKIFIYSARCKSGEKVGRIYI